MNAVEAADFRKLLEAERERVVSALAAKRTHNSLSFPSESLTSLSALRAMIAMTAAPMP